MTICISSSSHFALKSGKSKNNPVMFPPGRDKLATNPLFHGVQFQIQSDDRNGRSCSACGLHRRRTNTQNDIDFAIDKFGRERRESLQGAAPSAA